MYTLGLAIIPMVFTQFYGVYLGFMQQIPYQINCLQGISPILWGILWVYLGLSALLGTLLGIL